jgi:hypothetical protein
MLLREFAILAEEIRLFVRFVRARLVALRSGPAAYRWEVSVNLQVYTLMLAAHAGERGEWGSSSVKQISYQAAPVHTPFTL